MDSYDLIISVLALNPVYAKRVEQTGINRTDFLNDLLRNYPHPTLENVGIRPHKIHGDSALLNGATIDLVRNQVVKFWTPGDFFTWDYPRTHFQYFEERIQPHLADQELNDLEHFVKSL